MTKKLSQEFINTESRNLGTLSRLDEVLLNPQHPVRSGPVPETSRRNLTRKYPGTNNYGSQNDPHPEVGVFLSQTERELSPDETSYTECDNFCSGLDSTT